MQKMKLSHVLAAAMASTSLVLSGGSESVKRDVAEPELLKPVELRDASGEPERGLVDPFRRRGGEDDAENGRGGDVLMRTTMGEISSEFRILAITIPAGTNTFRTALIQLHNADEPILVHEGDLVRVDRTRSGKGARKAVPRRTAQKPAPRAPMQGDAELEDQLGKFVFYLNVKRIEPAYIEVYHNKKRPDETIRLNW